MIARSVHPARPEAPPLPLNIVEKTYCTLRHLCYIYHMARGPSGKTVVDLGPALKRDLHATLAADGLSLKDWLIGHARQYITSRSHGGVSYGSVPAEAQALMAAEDPAPYQSKPTVRRKRKP